MGHDKDTRLIQVLPNLLVVRSDVKSDLPAVDLRLPPARPPMLADCVGRAQIEGRVEIGRLNQCATIRTSNTSGFPIVAPLVHPPSTSRCTAGGGAPLAVAATG